MCSSDLFPSHDNGWYVRLERETKYQKSLHHNSVFVTITIAPEYYDSALLNPSSFIRLWFERIRRRFGHSIKHAVFQEFGIHPEQGNEPRLHFPSHDRVFLVLIMLFVKPLRM